MQKMQLNLCCSGVTGSSAASEGVCGKDKRNFFISELMAG